MGSKRCREFTEWQTEGSVRWEDGTQENRWQGKNLPWVGNPVDQEKGEIIQTKYIQGVTKGNNKKCITTLRRPVKKYSH